MNSRAKKWLRFLTIVIFLYWLPTLLTQAAIYYNKDWQEHAEASASQIADGRTYCIVWEQNNVGLWVPESFNDLNIEEVIGNEVVYKLRYLSFGFGSASASAARIKEMHFGILVDEKLYIWSFTEQRFSDEHAYYRDIDKELKGMRLFVERYRAIVDKPERQDQTLSKEKRIPEKYGANSNAEQSIYAKMPASVVIDQVELMKANRPGFKLDDLLCPHI